MRHLALAAALVLVASACAREAPPGEEYQAWNGPLTACEDPRPQDCSFELTELVCGRRHATWRTYRNPCTACRDEAVTGYRAAPCR